MLQTETESETRTKMTDEIISDTETTNATTPKPRTEAQREAARKNGARSRGPVTATGKATSARNRCRTRYNILAQTILIESESRAEFHKTLDSLERIFLPQDPYEISLTEMMAVASWRLTRLLEMERAAIGIQKLSPEAAAYEPAARAFLAYKSANSDGTLDHIHHQAARLDRQYHSAVQTLERYRRTRSDQAPNIAPGDLFA